MFTNILSIDLVLFRNFDRINKKELELNYGLTTEILIFRWLNCVGPYSVYAEMQ